MLPRDITTLSTLVLRPISKGGHSVTLMTPTINQTQNPPYDDIWRILGLSGYARVSDDTSSLLEWTAGFCLACTSVLWTHVYNQVEMGPWVLTRPYNNKYHLVSRTLLEAHSWVAEASSCFPVSPCLSNHQHVTMASGSLAVIPERPLYILYDLCADVFDTPVGMLKKAGDHDLGVAAAEVDVGWASPAK
jgi:hypothetical protein